MLHKSRNGGSASGLVAYAIKVHGVYTVTGQSDLEPAAAALLAQPAPSAAEQPLFEPLSDRELELLKLVAAGKSNREIAAELFLALGTVKSHLHNIYQKLGVRSRTQAIGRARELELL